MEMLKIIVLELNISQKKLENSLEMKNIIANIYRVQAYDSIIRGCCCIGIIDFMLKGKSLLQCTNLFFPKECKKNDKIIFKIFSVMEICCYVCNKYR